MKRLVVFILVLMFATSIFAENKYALLIANSKYKNFSSLDGPVKEARDLSKSLMTLGFSVELLENGTREQMIERLDLVKQKINGKGGVAFFHYGGHGVQAQGKNYLIPVDADIPDEKKLSTRAVDIDEVMSSLDLCGSDTNIVILDACRNNPLPAGSGRSASRGLSVVSVKPKNSIIVYSAEAGTVAQDGLFTPTLARLITQDGKSLNQILMQLRKEVSQKSNGSQIPGEYNQLFDDIFLNGNGNMVVTKNILPAENDKKSPMDNRIGSLVNGYDTTFYTNFKDDNAQRFTVVIPGAIKIIDNNAFLKSDTNGSFQRQYKFKRGSAAFIEFKSIDDSGILFAFTKDGFKRPGFQMVGLSFFDGQSIQAFEMHGENAQWTNQKWTNNGYKLNQRYKLLILIDETGILKFSLEQENGKVTYFEYSERLEDEMYSFAINFQNLQVYEYKELTRD